MRALSDDQCARAASVSRHRTASHFDHVRNSHSPPIPSSTMPNPPWHTHAGLSAFTAHALHESLRNGSTQRCDTVCCTAELSVPSRTAPYEQRRSCAASGWQCNADAACGHWCSWCYWCHVAGEQSLPLPLNIGHCVAFPWAVSSRFGRRLDCPLYTHASPT